jgi:hypothetical protein
MKADDLLLFTKRDEKGEPMGFESGLTVRGYAEIHALQGILAGCQQIDKNGQWSMSTSFPMIVEAARLTVHEWLKQREAADALIAESQKEKGDANT